MKASAISSHDARELDCFTRCLLHVFLAHVQVVRPFAVVFQHLLRNSLHCFLNKLRRRGSREWHSEAALAGCRQYKESYTAKAQRCSPCPVPSSLPLILVHPSEAAPWRDQERAPATHLFGGACNPLIGDEQHKMLPLVVHVVLLHTPVQHSMHALRARTPGPQAKRQSACSPWPLPGAKAGVPLSAGTRYASLWGTCAGRQRLKAGPDLEAEDEAQELEDVEEGHLAAGFWSQEVAQIVAQGSLHQKLSRPPLHNAGARGTEARRWQQCPCNFKVILQQNACSQQGELLRVQATRSLKRLDSRTSGGFVSSSCWPGGGMML